MSVLDWIKQTASNVGNFFQTKIAPAVNKGIEWANQKIVQPVAGALKNLPVIGSVASAVGQAGNAAQNLSEMAAGKRKFDVGEALGSAKEIGAGGQAVYNAVNKRR